MGGSEDEDGDRQALASRMTAATAAVRDRM